MCCKEKNCSKCIEQFIQDMILSNRSKKNNTSKKCPPSLLCTEHHEKHLAGTNITLENGEVKQRASHQKKKDVKSNAATSQGDGDDEDEDSKPKIKTSSSWADWLWSFAGCTGVYADLTVVWTTGWRNCLVGAKIVDSTPEYLLF